MSHARIAVALYIQTDQHLQAEPELFFTLANAAQAAAHTSSVSLIPVVVNHFNEGNVEGIVAGVPSLSEFATILDAGASVATGLIVFVMQAKLPMKRMRAITGVMIGVVLLVVGWLPTHPIRGLTLPYWVGLWFGTFAT